MIYDVDVVKCNAMKKKQRTPRVSGDQRALFRPLGALWEPSWGPLGALSVPTRLTWKKHESSATAVKQVPAAVGWSRGETLSKQVYLGWV